VELLLVVELVELLLELEEELEPHPASDHPGAATAVPARATATIAAENFILMVGWVEWV